MHACMNVCMHACMYMYVYMHAYLNNRSFFFLKKSCLFNFAFYTDNDKMWDLPRDCQRQNTGGLDIIGAYVLGALNYSPFSIVLLKT